MATANQALHLTAYSLRFAALCCGFWQQVSASVGRTMRPASAMPKAAAEFLVDLFEKTARRLQMD